MAVHIKDKEDFKTKLEDAKGNLVVVDFHATWCGPCKAIAPKIEEYAKEFANVVFLKVDVDECEDIAETYGIRAMPTFVFIKNKEKLEEFSGANASQLKEVVERLK